MADWTGVVQVMNEKANALESLIQEYRDELLGRIEKAKQDEILLSLEKINARLDKIEYQLAEKDKPAEGDDGVEL